MLLSHPRIYLDATGEYTDSLLIRRNKVLAVGEDARHAATSQDPRLRPDGACLFPALGDAHIHLWGLGLRPGTIDLRGLDADAALDRLADAASGGDGWIYATNLDEHHFSADQQLTRRELDRLFPTRPIRIQRVDRHAIWVNGEALRRAGIDQHFQPGDDGHAARDDSGELTGLLVDGAMTPVLEAIPPTTLTEDRQSFLEASELLRQQGIAFCTVARCPVAHIEMLKDLADAGELPLYVDALVAGTDDGLEGVLRSGPFDDGGKLRIAGIKFYADGALGSAGAHLLSSYRRGGKGLAMHAPGFLKRRIPQLMKGGWQVAVHAIGDAAAREVLDAFQDVPSQRRRQLRPRMEHAQMVDPVDAPRFDELDVIASIQPIHLRSDAPWAPTMLDDSQLSRLFAWRSLLPAALAAGSDYPIDDLNPWHGIATAMTRRGADENPFRPDHALTRREILSAYTDGAAFASHREDYLGKLHPGFNAEVAILDVDPFRAEPDEIWETSARLLSAEQVE